VEKRAVEAAARANADAPGEAGDVPDAAKKTAEAAANAGASKEDATAEVMTMKMKLKQKQASHLAPHPNIHLPSHLTASVMGGEAPCGEPNLAARQKPTEFEGAEGSN
jgi:hypothetical protein